MRMSMRPASMAARKHAKKKPASRRGSTNILARLKSYVTYSEVRGRGRAAKQNETTDHNCNNICGSVEAWGRPDRVPGSKPQGGGKYGYKRDMANIA